MLTARVNAFELDMNSKMLVRYSRKFVSSLVSLSMRMSVAAACLLLPGCITFSNYSIPADRIPEGVKGVEKGDRQQLNLALLGQAPPPLYTLDSGDVLGIYVKGLVPAGADQAAPVLQGQPNFSNVYYPPDGQSSTPSMGLPFEINAAGRLQLPLIGEVDLRGLTIGQATEQISKKYIARQLIQEGKEYVYVNMVRSRVVRVMVIRDDVASGNPTFLSKTAPLLTKRGNAQVVDLPAFENDVLHALTISGGLPGYESYNEVWVLRRSDLRREVYSQVWDSPPKLREPSATGRAASPDRSMARPPIELKDRNGPTEPSHTEELSEPRSSANRYRSSTSKNSSVAPLSTPLVQTASAQSPLVEREPPACEFDDFEPLLLTQDCQAIAKRIPLWVEPCERICIRQEDILLQEGDIVYIRGREQDFFYTAGLLPGGIVPMPRDHDIDIVEAISLANGSIGGVGGASGIAVIRTGTGPGNILPPTRAIITRKLPNKQQVSIRVDLTQSLRDPKHRPIVQPGDLITLQYKPGEVVGNSMLNLVNLNYTLN